MQLRGIPCFLCSSCLFSLPIFLLSKQAGADPSLGSNGQTPLGIAAAQGETEVIKCLLKAGANPNVTDVVSLTIVIYF